MRFAQHTKSEHALTAVQNGEIKEVIRKRSSQGMS